MNSSQGALGLYFHIPYCLKKCPYCDFNSYALKETDGSKLPQDTEDSYIAALLRELEHYSEELSGKQCKSIFFGGGTPSLLSSESVSLVLRRSSELFPFTDEIEITLESNPGTIAEPLASSKLKSFRDAGINRISMGAQSFSANKLQQLGRIHSAKDTVRAVENIKQAGYDNFSLDLIFGVIGESLENWRLDLTSAIALSPKHISAYCLTIEPGTEFGRLAKKGTQLTVKEDEFAAEFRLTQKILNEHGFNQYEISNFSKPNHECRHNLGYWRRESYLGIGAGAHGFLENTPDWGYRWWNLPGPEKYIDQVNKTGHGTLRFEEVSKEQAEIEFFLLHLRTTKGLALDKYQSLFKKDLLISHANCIEDLSKQELIKLRDNHIQPTEKGLLFSDTIFSRFAEQAG